jgi:eukaryotic-like serine/threonine-protein kinase
VDEFWTAPFTRPRVNGTHSFAGRVGAVVDQIPNSPTMTKRRSLQQSKYRILGQVGQGQFAQVFCGMRRATGELVALKAIDRQRFSTQRFLHELHLLSRLRHPNIVQFQTLDYSPKGRYLVMDYCAGGTLRDLMESAFPLKLTECLNFIMAILQGLAHAHEQGVVHCDLKPENILLVPEGSGWTARIADFGVSRLVENLVSRGADAEPIGSPAYMAPESYYQRYSPASDLYAVGILLYELLLGQRPFGGRPGELMNAHLNQRLVLPPVVPFPLRSVITTALRRFGSAQAMLKSVMLAAAILQATQPESLACGRAVRLLEPGATTLAVARSNTATTIATIAPDGSWMAIAQPQGNTATFQILRLPGLTPIGRADDWAMPEQLCAIDQRHGLAVLADGLGDCTWRLFNRRGGWFDYCRLPATIGPIVVNQRHPDRLLAIAAADPTIAFLVDLKPLKVKRIALEFRPDDWRSVAEGFELTARSGQVWRLDHDGLLVNELHKPAYFKVLVHCGC